MDDGDEATVKQTKKRKQADRSDPLPYGAYGCHNCAARLAERDALLGRTTQLEESVASARAMLLDMFTKINECADNPLQISAVVRTTFRDMFGHDMAVYIPALQAFGTKSTS